MNRKDSRYRRRGDEHPLDAGGASTSDRRSVLRALAALGLLSAGGVLGWRRTSQQPSGLRRGSADVRLVDTGMMDGANMGQYRDIHSDLTAVVQSPFNGVRAHWRCVRSHVAAEESGLAGGDRPGRR